MPPDIKEFIKVELNKGDVIVEVLRLSDQQRSRLIFNNDGKMKGSVNSITIYGYLDRLVRFSRQNILIYVNNILLTDIKLPALAYEEVLI